MTITLDGNLDSGPSIRWHVSTSCGWPGRSVVSNMLMFQDDIAASIDFFCRFPAN
jgi:hypothetical protein